MQSKFIYNLYLAKLKKKKVIEMKTLFYKSDLAKNCWFSSYS